MKHTGLLRNITPKLPEQGFGRTADSHRVDSSSSVRTSGSASSEPLSPFMQPASVNVDSFLGMPPGRAGNQGPRPRSVVPRPALPETSRETPPEMIPVLSLLTAHSARVYEESYFMLLKDLNNDGKPVAKREWREVYGLLTGTVFSIWDAETLQAAEKGENVDPPSPTYINVTDSTFKSIKRLASATADIEHVIVLSTTMKNRYLLQFATRELFDSWTAALRLAMFERQSLQEAYTGALFAAKGAHLNGIRTLLSEHRQKKEEWCQVRFGAGMQWKRVWAVITPANLQKKRKERKAGYGTVAFYESPKLAKKRPLSTIVRATAAYAVFPERAVLMESSTLIKLDGLVLFQGDEEEKESAVCIMPEQRPGIQGYEMLIRFLIPLLDVFQLYGRPKRLNADKYDIRSMLFAMPTLPKVYYCEPADVKALLSLPKADEWLPSQWTQNIKELLARKIANGYRGCGNLRVVTSAVSLPFERNHGSDHNEHFSSSSSSKMFLNFQQRSLSEPNTHLNVNKAGHQPPVSRPKGLGLHGIKSTSNLRDRSENEASESLYVIKRMAPSVPSKDYSRGFLSPGFWHRNEDTTDRGRSASAGNEADHDQRQKHRFSIFTPVTHRLSILSFHSGKDSATSRDQEVIHENDETPDTSDLFEISHRSLPTLMKTNKGDPNEHSPDSYSLEDDANSGDTATEDILDQYASPALGTGVEERAADEVLTRPLSDDSYSVSDKNSFEEDDEKIETEDMFASSQMQGFKLQHTDESSSFVSAPEAVTSSAVEQQPQSPSKPKHMSYAEYSDYVQGYVNRNSVAPSNMQTVNGNDGRQVNQFMGSIEEDDEKHITPKYLPNPLSKESQTHLKSLDTGDSTPLQLNEKFEPTTPKDFEDVESAHEYDVSSGLPKIRTESPSLEPPTKQADFDDVNEKIPKILYSPVRNRSQDALQHSSQRMQPDQQSQFSQSQPSLAPSMKPYPPGAMNSHHRPYSPDSREISGRPYSSSPNGAPPQGGPYSYGDFQHQEQRRPSGPRPPPYMMGPHGGHPGQNRPNGPRPPPQSYNLDQNNRQMQGPRYVHSGMQSQLQSRGQMQQVGSALTGPLIRPRPQQHQGFPSPNGRGLRHRHQQTGGSAPTGPIIHPRPQHQGGSALTGPVIRKPPQNSSGYANGSARHQVPQREMANNNLVQSNWHDTVNNGNTRNAFNNNLHSTTEPYNAMNKSTNQL